VHHREVHRQGDERAWWSKLNIDPMPIALRYWQHTRGIPTKGLTNPEPLYSAAEAQNGLAELPSGEISASRSIDIATSGSR
jgi:hypothetical protein